MDNMETTITSDRRFAIVDEWVLDLPVSDRAIRLYAVLVRYADHQTHKAFPSRRTLAERLRCSMKSVDRAVQELIDAGALSKKQRFNSSLVFTIHTVSSGLSRGVDTGDEGGWTPVTRGVDTGDDLTITTELEPTELEPQKSAQRQNKETRLPEDWTPSERLMEMFETKWPHLEPDYEVEQFINYWLSVNTRKADWDRTFQVWMNKNEKDADKRGLVRGKRLTNNEQAALLAMKYREQHAQAEITSETNPGRARQIETEATSWMKGIDDV